MDKLEIVKSITEYIEMRLKSDAEALSLDEIADKIGYSKFYLNRIFKETTEVTIHRYILERRLTQAAKKLTRTDKTIADISYEAGYQSQQAFTSAFSKHYLCTPMRYRAGKQYSPLRRPYQTQGMLVLFARSKLAVAV